MENVSQILSLEQKAKIKEATDKYISSFEEIIKDTLKEKQEQIASLKKELKEATEQKDELDEHFGKYEDQYHEDNSFVCESIEDQRKLEALKRNWDNISFDDIDKLCKF